MNTRVVLLPKLCNDTSPTDFSVGDFCLGWEPQSFVALFILFFAYEVTHRSLQRVEKVKLQEKRMNSVHP